MTRRAAFLDRDGVLVADRGFVTAAEQFEILPGVPEALAKLADAGFALVVVTNQAVVARGLLTEIALAELHAELGRILLDAGAPPFDAIYACPHHPHADEIAYRIACECRKPKPGLLKQAARDLDLDLSRSAMIGDRPTDVAAGASAGCRTILVEGPRTGEAIVTAEPLGEVTADYICGSLADAADWLVRT